jgi:hypothetical protein
MPTYVFQDENGIHEDVFMSSTELGERQFMVEGKRGQFIKQDGRTIKRVYVPFGGQQPSCWPLRSQAAGVGVEQIDEQIAYDRSVGLSSEFDRKSGDAIFHGAKERKKYLRHHGLIDKDSYI